MAWGRWQGETRLRKAYVAAALFGMLYTKGQARRVTIDLGQMERYSNKAVCE